LNALRVGRQSLRCGVERLEVRACPAAVSIGSVSLAEGTNSSPVAKFVISLSEKSSRAVVVNWATADGTATVADNDYRTTSGTVVFAPGQTTRTIGVYVCGDTKVEGDETFSLNLTRAVGATFGNASATATIVNDDVTPAVIPTVTIGDADVPERNVGRSEARFKVELSEPTDQPVTVRYATVDGTAMASDADYIGVSRAVVFAPGETSKMVGVSVLGDSRIETDETFGLVLSAAMNATIGKTTGMCTIRNDDFAPPKPLVASVSGGATAEGNGSPDPQMAVSFTITLSRSPASVVTVGYRTLDGFATLADNDYVATSGVVQFGPGETSKTVLVPVVGDTKPERNETFFLSLVSANGAVPDLFPATATITDDDTPPELRVDGDSVLEGNTGNTPVSFVLTLSSAWTKPVVVNYATRDDSAKASDSDYVPVKGTVTFAPGETRATVDVSVVGDTRPETDERFYLDLSSASNATIVAGTGTAIIQNDDSGDAPGFQITVDFNDPTLPESTKQLFRNAADRWSQIITGDLPAVTYNGRVIDDFLLDVTVKSLNPNLLGQATYYPDSLRPGPRGLPSRGFAEFNSTYMNAPGIYYTILHEMAHALGFNSDLWSSTGFGLVSGLGKPGASNPVFTGVNATREYNAYFGTRSASVPLDDVHGEGSYGTHWRESVFGASSEVMTYAWDVYSSRVDPVSKVTIGAMADIGYTVDYAAADPYKKPSASVLPGGQVAASTYAAPIRSSSAQQSRALGGAVTPHQSVRKATSLPNDQAMAWRSLTEDAAIQPDVAVSARPAEGGQRATAKTPRERMFVALAVGVASASERPLATLAWRALGPT